MDNLALDRAHMVGWVLLVDLQLMGELLVTVAVLLALVTPIALATIASVVNFRGRRR